MTTECNSINIQTQTDKYLSANINMYICTYVHVYERISYSIQSNAVTIQKLEQQCKRHTNSHIKYKLLYMYVCRYLVPTTTVDFVKMKNYVTAFGWLH